jgi:hypothetical protein
MSAYWVDCTIALVVGVARQGRIQAPQMQVDLIGLTNALQRLRF